MQAAPNILPKWLLLLVVFGVFVGQVHQMICKAGGHESAAQVSASATLSASDDGCADNDAVTDPGCAFHCHLSNLSLATFGACPSPSLQLCSFSRVLIHEDNPTSRADSIDLPPQIA